MPSEAPTCRAALNQATVRWPGRSRKSDGIMSSSAHRQQNPSSDHDYGNAFDLTHDPQDGPDCAIEAGRLVQMAKDGKAPWLKYVIFNRRIASKERGWGWRPYDGDNAHTLHMHVSIFSTFRNNDIDWWDRPAPSPKESDMSPAQEKKLDRVIDLLEALVAPRRPDKVDQDTQAISLGDVLTHVEKAK